MGLEWPAFSLKYEGDYTYSGSRQYHLDLGVLGDDADVVVGSVVKFVPGLEKSQGGELSLRESILPETIRLIAISRRDEKQPYERSGELNQMYRIAEMWHRPPTAVDNHSLKLPALTPGP
ncbi:hypothetical protein PQX77_014756 [Marasmius sp. AFHP31]|nr:hypothetical protein PQX77_014756 [Marasmius sp. AFHP31]